MDLAEFLKSEYQSLYKMKKSFGDILNAARKAQNDNRRMTRHAEILLKRNINEDTLSPYVTPKRRKTPKKIVEKAVDKNKKDEMISKRYEQLLAWKREKEKRKQEQRQKAKPMFKVSHLPVVIGLPDLENVNKQIKGKMFLTKHNETYKFAPANHKFKAPSNIKPLKIEQVNSAGLSGNNFKRVTRSQKTVLPMFELPSKKYKVNLKDTNKVQVPGKLGAEKSTECSASSKRVTLHNESKPIKLDPKVYKKTPAKAKSSESTKYETRKNLVQKSNVFTVGSKSVKDKVTENKADNFKTLVKSKDVKNQPENSSKKSRPLNENKNKLVAAPPFNAISSNEDKINDTQIDTCDSTKPFARQQKNLVKVENSKKKSGKTKSEVIENNEQNKNGSDLKEKPVNMRGLRSRSSSRKFLHLTEDNRGGTASKDAAGNDTKQMAIKQEQKKGGKKNVVDPISKDEAKENQIGNHKTPVKEKRASMKGDKTQQELRSSTRKSQHSKENQGVTSSEDPDEVEVDTKQQRKSKTTRFSMQCPSEDVHSGLNDGAEKNMYVTPNKKIQNPVIYISPFVTISRGKSSARKEYFQRKSRGGECDSSPDVLRSTGVKAGAAYFQRILEQEMNRIQALCNEWTDYKDTQNPPEEASDMINVAIGQSQLLISKKFKQFQGLINSCATGNSEIPVTCEDLHGYWDVAYIQVENLDKRFENLVNLRRNNWEEILPQTNRAEGKKKMAPKKPKGKVTSSLKDAIRAARVKAKSQKTVAVDGNQSGNTTTFDGKFFTITSPHKSPLRKSSVIGSAKKSPRRERTSLRAAVLSTEASKRKSTPVWNIIKASQVALAASNNAGSEMTPGRSILKNPQLGKQASKSVLFEDSVHTSLNLNETYPPANSREKSPVLKNITNNDDSSRRTPKRRSSRNKLF